MGMDRDSLRTIVIEEPLAYLEASARMQGAHRPRNRRVINLNDIDSILRQADLSLGRSRYNPQQQLG
jgi:hypothetical protein